MPVRCPRRNALGRYLAHFFPHMVTVCQRARRTLSSMLEQPGEATCGEEKETQ
jgi:hypothetical protein